MCGISGAVNFNNELKSEDEKLIHNFSECMQHRGPDAGGICVYKNIIFSHRRLSIIDLNEQSNQPMVAVDNDTTIVFNGEIYNHEEIKKDLVGKYPFKTTNSDTEVIINAYKEWGIKCIDKFVGMFAIAIYDKQRKKVFLVRDRLGKKPLYYTKVNGTLYFASENQAFFKSNLIKKEFDDESIYHYLSFLTTPAPKTFFKNINKLQAGHYMEISENKIEEHEYWSVSNFINQPKNCSFDEAYAKTHSLLEKSMEHRNVSDVPISIALSGGLDSSLNLFYAKKIREDNIAAINISFDKTAEGNEEEVARRFTKEKGVDFISHVLTKDAFNEWIESYLKISKDVPAGDPNSALIFGISRIARDNGYKVLLVGEGGDELGGYPVYKNLRYLNLIFKYVPKNLINLAISIIPKNKFTKRLIRGLSIPDYASRFVFGFSEIEKEKFWKKNNKYDSYGFIKKIADEIEDNFEDSYLRKIINIEYKFRLPELLLPRVDYPSMAASIEARSPFMDHRLIEYSVQIPWKVKMKNGPKTLLKKISKDKLPDYIINSPKVGFGELLNPFFDTTLSDWFKKNIVDSDCPIKEYIDENFISTLYQRHKKYKNYGFQIWTIYSLNLWMTKNQS